jgi:hypothetical protein
LRRGRLTLTATKTGQNGFADATALRRGRLTLTATKTGQNGFADATALGPGDSRSQLQNTVEEFLAALISLSWTLLCILRGESNAKSMKVSAGSILLVLSLFFSSCSTNNDNSHTTATTVVPPPPRQILRVVPHSPQKPGTREGATRSLDPNLHADPTKPLLIFNLENGQTFHEGEEVMIDFSLSNAKLRVDGGEYRVRYIVDDDDPQWIDKWEPLWLAGWTEGKHTIRLELIGPDGWPVSNGDYNIITREISVVAH